MEQEDDDQPSGSASASASNNPKVSKKNKLGPKLKGRDVLGFEPGSDCSWLVKSDYDPEFPLTPSSKTLVLKTLLLRGFAEAPLDKVCIPKSELHFLIFLHSRLFAVQSPIPNRL